LLWAAFWSGAGGVEEVLGRHRVMLGTKHGPFATSPFAWLILLQTKT